MNAWENARITVEEFMLLEAGDIIRMKSFDDDLESKDDIDEDQANLFGEELEIHHIDCDHSDCSLWRVTTCEDSGYQFFPSDIAYIVSCAAMDANSFIPAENIEDLF